MIINAHQQQFENLVDALLKKETIEGDEVDAIVHDKSGFREDSYMMA
jgi:cell division protease FtsH